MKDDASQRLPPTGIRLAGLAALIVVAVAGHLWLNDLLTIESVIGWEKVLRGYQQTSPRAVYVAAFSAYVALAGLSMPGAFVLTLVFGWYFGFLPSLLLVSFASTAGASLGFLFSRYVLRDLFRSRFGSRLRTFNDALARDGAFYLFTLRLVPAVPFFFVNLVMGLTPVSLRTFWWVSQVGMLPGTAVYAYAGASVPDLQQLSQRGAEGIMSLQLLSAFVLLGLFPLFARLVIKRARPYLRR